MKSKSAAGLYLLLIIIAAISMTYYVAGVVALREEFFHPSRYISAPFEVKDDGQTLQNVRKEALDAGLANGDVLLTLQGQSYTGYAQSHDLRIGSHLGQTEDVSVREVSGRRKSAHIPLAARQGPGFSLWGYLAFLSPILGVPLLGLLVGYWVVAGRPRDLNAWLVLVVLASPETLFGNLDWTFWPHPWYLLLDLWNNIVQGFAFLSLLWFGLLFPERWRLDLRFPWFKHVMLAATVCIFALEMAFSAAQLFAVGRLQPYLGLQTWTDRADSSLQLVCTVVFLAAVFDKLRSATTADARRRLRILAIGSGLSFGPLLLIFGLAPWFGIDPHHGQWFTAIVPLVALFPITLAYVLIVQRAMDVRILLRMGTRYLLARATLLVLESAVVALLLGRFVIPMLEHKEHPFLNFLLLALCVAGLFQMLVQRGSVGSRLKGWLDRRFFREAYNSELVLSELSQQVRQLTDQSQLIDTVLRRIAEVLHVTQAAILLRGANAFELQQALVTDGLAAGPVLALPDSSASVRQLVRTSQPATLYRDRPEAWFADAGAEEKIVLHQMNAELLLPMPGRAGLMGLMALGPKRSEQPYSPTDLRTLQSVAAQTGLTLEVVELVRTLAEQAAQRERMTREIEIAREVQQRLFPQTIPEIAGVSLAGMCRPALEVGGDYYDLIPLTSGLLGFAIGDVSGKGISAALIMASLRASLRSLILDDCGDLADIIEKVNRLVYEASSTSRYATFFFATYNPATHELRYVNAGHNPPLLVRAATGECELLQACGPVVGLLPFTAYTEESAVLTPGDVLVAYTDGISEAMSVDDEEWGEARMLEALPRNPSVTASSVLQALFHAADAFTAGAEQHDDMTLLVLKLLPA